MSLQAAGPATIGTGEPQGWARFILGDWGRFVRDPLDVMRIAFFIGTIVWVVTEAPLRMDLSARRSY